jgi:hypothetical protein
MLPRHAVGLSAVTKSATGRRESALAAES